jgi:anthranilate phosphoribosyltransferase
MNAAAALLAGDKVKELKAGVRLAEEVIDSGRAREKLDGLVKLSQSLG